MKYTAIGLSLFFCLNTSFAQKNEMVKLESYPGRKESEYFYRWKTIHHFPLFRQYRETGALSHSCCQWNDRYEGLPVKHTAR